MSIIIKNRLDILLSQLASGKSFDVAEEITKEICGLLGITTKERFLANISRVDAEISRFQLAPGFARQAAAYELKHDNTKPFDLKLFWLKNTTKTNLLWSIGLTPNFEDAQSNDTKNIGIDFAVPESCDSIMILLSNRLKVRVLELKDHITPTQLEILSSWKSIGQLEIVDKSILHAKLWESFNFEPVNRRFYLELVEHFSVLVQHLEKQFDRKASVMFTTRLLGRLLFIWFLQKKNLINKSIGYFKVSSPTDQTGYYKKNLEKLFFEVLNREVLERSNGDTITPYLNGGLFDTSSTDFYKDSKLTFPDGYFTQLFETLNKYNFTVDESSPEFQQVAIDPEMLGQIFESLLAEQIDEITGKSEKKAKGTFYTPREIVAYMCEESLIQYLKTKITDTPDRDRRLEELVRMPESIFRDQDQNKRRDWKPYRDSILSALYDPKNKSALTVLDPAVGSGAFPMGMLHLLIKIYSRLDPKYEKDIAGLKRNILSRSLYGVDIEQTAIEITRLRAWLSIVVDLPEGEPVEPLPNLEFKFVCANTLITLDTSKQSTFTADPELKQKLIDIRDEYYRTSSKAKKEKLQTNYLKLTYKKSLFDDKETLQLKSYKPFDVSSSSEFYDPELMHGVEAFDVVIGNPPYISALVASKTIRKEIREYYKKKYISAQGTYDIYLLFFERGFSLLESSGGLVYITPTKYLSANYACAFREKVGLDKLVKVTDFSRVRVFENAGVTTFVSIFSNQVSNDYIISNIFDQTTDFNTPKVIKNSRKTLSAFPEYLWGHLISDNFNLLDKIYQKSNLFQTFSINGSSTASEGDEFTGYISEESDGQKIINTGTIKPFVSLWGTKLYSNKKEKILKPYLNLSKISQRRKDMYLSPKIIVPKLNKRLMGIVDTKGEYASTNTTFIYNFDSQKDIKLAGALINSTLYDFIYKSIFSGLNLLGSFQYQAPQIRILPFPKKIDPKLSSKIESLVDQILEIKEGNPDADTTTQEHQIDDLVYELYGLSKEEKQIISNS